jgi:hypothetical protein
MRLEFSKRYLSIFTFPAIEVPPLTVVVGLNGSGKTHLLQAIQNGSITNSIAQIPAGNMPGMHEGPIKLLSANGTQINDSGPYHSLEGQPNNGQNMSEGRFDIVRRDVLRPFSAALDQLSEGRLVKSLRATEDIWRLGVDEVVARDGNESNRSRIEQIFKDAEAELLKPLNVNQSHRHMDMSRQLLSSLRSVSSKLGVSPLAVTEYQEQQLRPWQTDQFQHNLPMLFGRYRDALLRNSLAQLRDQHEGTATSMTNEDFVGQFGKAPWKQISETFEAFNLPTKPMLLTCLHFHKFILLL